MKYIIGLMLAFCVTFAWGQTPPTNLVTTAPLATAAGSAGNASGAIVGTNTFQTIWTQSTNNRGRAGCTIQNKSANNMYVYFGTTASALTNTSVTLAPGAAAYCNTGPIVLQDTVSITGTSGDRYYANQQ